MFTLPEIRDLMARVHNAHTHGTHVMTDADESEAIRFASEVEQFTDCELLEFITALQGIAMGKVLKREIALAEETADLDAQLINLLMQDGNPDDDYRSEFGPQS
jgi:hypothetical protein